MCPSSCLQPAEKAAATIAAESAGPGTAAGLFRPGIVPPLPLIATWTESSLSSGPYMRTQT